MTPQIIAVIVGCVMVLATGMPASHAANLVVVEARGIDLKPGAEIDGDKPLELKDGQVVTLISPSGEIIKLHGPMNTAPAPTQSGSSVDVRGALKTLVTRELADNSELGVVRGAADDPIPPQPWLVDVTHDGTRCLPENNPIVFWRPGGGGADTVSIAPYDRSWLARAEWQAGSDRLLIGGTVPLRSSGQLRCPNWQERGDGQASHDPIRSKQRRDASRLDDRGRMHIPGEIAAAGCPLRPNGFRVIAE